MCHCGYFRALTALCASPFVLDLLNAFKMICLKISCYKPEHFPEFERGTLLAVTRTSLFERCLMLPAATQHSLSSLSPNSQEEGKIK